jgi:hypothetical protein
MRYALIYFLLSFKLLSTEEFFISEIFASDKKSHWFEILNLSDNLIIINHIKLELFEDTKKILDINKILTMPVIFKKYIIITNNFNLGLDSFVSAKITRILLSDLVFAKPKKLTLCLTLNKNNSTCASLESHHRFQEYTSLYRSQPDSLWLNEPCMVSPRLFATPGFAEKACADEPDFAHAIAAGEDSLRNYIQTKVLQPAQASKPKLNFVKFEKSKLEFLYHDSDLSDLWQASLCSTPRESEIICHELITPFVVNPNQMLSYDLSPDTTIVGQTLMLEVRDLYGLTDNYKHINNNFISYSKPDLKIQNISRDTYKIKFYIGPESVPANFIITALAKEIIISQKVLSVTGNYDFNFITPEKLLDIKIYNKNYSWEYDQNLSELCW